MGCSLGSTSGGKSGVKSPNQEVLNSLSSHLSVKGRYHPPPQKLEHDYQIQEETVLGTGINGSVFKATSKHRHGDFAVKGFKVSGMCDVEKTLLRHEVDIFLAMDHPHIARLIDVYEDSTQLYLVMECLHGGELLERIRKQKRFSEKDAAHAVRQMLLAVNYIHSHGVVHGDLKLDNFIYEDKSSNHLRLIDFGFSRIQEKGAAEVSCPVGRRVSFVGTLAYAAPEVLTKSYTCKCDLWSIGVITVILLLGYMPFGGCEHQKMKENIKKAQWERKNSWNTLSKAAQQFIERLIIVDADERMSAEEALMHPFIKQGERQSLTLLASDRDQAIASLNVGEDAIKALCSFAQASRFRRACLLLAAWSLTPEERSQVRDAFVELDVNQQGSIELRDLRQVLMGRSQFDTARTDEIIDSLAATHKKDVLHYSDFLAAMVSTRISGLHLNDKHIASTFRRFDKEGKGHLSATDFGRLLGDSFSEEEIERIVQALSTGPKGEIGYDRLLAYLSDAIALQADRNDQPLQRVISDDVNESDEYEDQCQSGTIVSL